MVLMLGSLPHTVHILGATFPAQKSNKNIKIVEDHNPYLFDLGSGNYWRD